MNRDEPSAEQLEQQLEQAWQLLALDRFLSGSRPQSAPQAILVAGQPGAGKSVLAEAARRGLREQGGCVTIDPTELLLLHPGYTVATPDDADLAGESLRGSAAQLAGQLVEEAVKSRRHLVLVCTFDTAEMSETLATYLHDRSYRVVVLIPCVAPAQSWSRVCRRNDPLHSARCVLRVSQAEHDDKCCRLLDALDHLERSDAVDELHLLTGDGQLIASRPAADRWSAGTCREQYNQALADRDAVQLEDRDREAIAESRAILRVPRADLELLHPKLRRNDGRNAYPDWSRLTPEEIRQIERRLEFQETLRRVAASESSGV
ncbi:MAG: zeta toxin family protein [Planctomycetaceae bacterium]|nr:zeta toxin family protein [Planctomycetaceae bacterium]